MTHHYVQDPQAVEHLHEGPLGPYIDAYAAELCAEGYAQQSAAVQVHLVRDFSRWLAEHRIPVPAITPDHVPAYLRARAQYRRPRRDDRATLRRLWNLLRRQGVIPEPSRPAQTPADHLQDTFRNYLRQERALAPATLVAYLGFTGEFLTARFGAGPIDLATLSAADVTGFVQRRAAMLRSKRVQLLTTALRAFLRFARARGALATDLAACVPAVANWSRSTVPRALPPAQVEAVLAACNRQTAVGRRDYAILLLLARLGLRAGEVVALTLEDLDWQAGVLTVRGKGGRASQLPLPVEVGEAIAAYVQDGRPRATSRCVFLRARAPVRSFQGPLAVGSVVKHALARAGVASPRKGAHQFRHSLACQLLRQGASLAEIGELLRHRSPQTTTIYAKVDLAALAPLALAWPGGVQ
jgi:site-specific recombinase XerD